MFDRSDKYNILNDILVTVLVITLRDLGDIKLCVCGFFKLRRAFFYTMSDIRIVLKNNKKTKTLVRKLLFVENAHV